ncbi:hypothetical protein ACET3Z_024879 [Daucus carota]
MNCVTAEECLSLFGNLPTELRVEVFVRLPVTVMLEVMGAELLMDEFEYIGKLQSDVISRRDPTAFVLTSRNIANSWRHFVVASDVMILLSYLGSCQENESLIVCGTSRGYTCHVYRNYTDRKILIVLFNPSVNHQVVLPAPDIPVTFGFQNLYRGGLEDLYRDDDCCFGFLGDSNAFKVLRFANATDAEIFRSEENRWCKLILDWPCIDGGFISLKKDPKLPLMLLPRPVTYFIGQKFYWIAADEGFDFKAIVSLDINSESFEITTTVDEPYASNLQLGIVGGHLYVHKRIAGAGCAISLVKTELAWKACQEEHLYPAAFYHQFVETGAYEIPVFPFSQTLEKSSTLPEVVERSVQEGILITPAMEGEFDLDLTYITDNIIAIGFPPGDMTSLALLSAPQNETQSHKSQNVIGSHVLLELNMKIRKRRFMWRSEVTGWAIILNCDKWVITCNKSDTQGLFSATIWLLMQVLLMSHVGEENCASVWSFSYFSAEDYDASTNSGVSHEAKEHNWSR